MRQLPIKDGQQIGVQTAQQETFMIVDVICGFVIESCNLYLLVGKVHNTFKDCHSYVLVAANGAVSTSGEVAITEEEIMNILDHSVFSNYIALALTDETQDIYRALEESAQVMAVISTALKLESHLREARSGTIKVMTGDNSYH